jgi:DNA-binding XRE family transcriptional regulator
MTHSYIRAYRRRSALSQEQLGLLLGISRNAVNEFERHKRAPTLPLVLRLQAIFGVPPHALFPVLYEAVEEAAMAEAVRLHNSLEGKADRQSAVLRTFLEAMPKRGLPDGLAIADA